MKNIFCDFCGFYDRAEIFPDDINSPILYFKTMSIFGHEDDAVRNLGLGVVCPSCGNHYEFDFDPDCER